MKMKPFLIIAFILINGIVSNAEAIPNTNAGGIFNEIIVLHIKMPAGKYFVQITNEKLKYSQAVFIE